MGKFSEMDIEVQGCVEDLKQLRGIAPHNHPSNIVYGDGYFANSIDAKYTRQVREEAERRLEVECTKLTVRITPAQHALIADLITEERSGMSASRAFVVDDDLEEWDDKFDSLTALQEALNT